MLADDNRSFIVTTARLRLEAQVDGPKYFADRIAVAVEQPTSTLLRTYVLIFAMRKVYFKVFG